MAELFRQFLEMSLTASGMIGAVLLVRRFLAKKVNPTVMLLLWALVLARLCLPFTVASPVHVVDLIPEQAAVSIGQDPLQNDTTTPAEGAAAGASAGSPNLPQANPQPSQGASQTPPGTGAGKTFAQALGDFIRNIPLWNALAAIWAAGTMASLLLFLKQARRFRKKLCICNPVTDTGVLQTIERHKTTAGVKKEVAALQCDFVHAPAVFGFLKPCILIPSQFIRRMDANSLSAILLHEIYHIRSRDILMNYVWLIAKALHWFNPLVWFAYKWFEHDVELCRDQKAAQQLSSDGALAYSKALMQAARVSGRSAAAAPALTASLFANKCRLKERIVRLMKPQQRSKASAALCALLALLMLFSGFTTACQPTPEKPVVQSKDNDSVQNAIEGYGQSPDQTHRYQAPQAWQGQTRDEAKKISVNVDTRVIVPTDTWGIYHLISKEPDEAYLDRILNALIGDAELYGENTYRSREELEAEVVRIKGQIARIKTLEQDPQPPAGTPVPGNVLRPGADVVVDIAQTLADFERQLQAAEQALANAPAQGFTEKVAIDTGLLFDSAAQGVDAEAWQYEGTPSVLVSGGYVEIYGLADTGKAGPAQVSLFYSRQSGSTHIRIDNTGAAPGGLSGGELLTGEPLFGLAISQDEAAKTARQAVAEMGLGYLDIAAVHSISVYDRARMEGDKMPELYAFTFSRSLDGVPATYAYWNGGVTKEELEEYAARWRVDEAVIGVDDSGVVFVEINVPPTDVEQLARGIELKPFEQIMEIFNQQAIIEGCYSPFGNQEDIVGREVSIDEIRLGYMPTNWKDHPNQIIFVPVWDFFGSEATQFDKSIPRSERGDLFAALDENYQFHYDYGAQAVLTVNALDGTIMRRSWASGR